MALSTIKISDTMEWTKRLTFGRNSGLGNALEPALSNANIVLQTILGPPFSWWWNNEDLVFTCSPTLATAAITNIAITSNVLTITAANTFSVGQEIIPSAINVATFLNGKILQVLTANATTITANFVHIDYVSAANTGTLTAATTQDYTVASPEFSHIDYASVQDISKTPAKWMPLNVRNTLSLGTETGRPADINPQSQDTAGNMTFRMLPAPDKAYPVLINIMKVAPQKTSLNDTWAPLPDFMQYIFSYGFLALTYMFTDDSRVGFANAKFTAGLLARADGLTEEERNIFLANWDALTGQAAHQQGMQARAT